MPHVNVLTIDGKFSSMKNIKTTIDKTRWDFVGFSCFFVNQINSENLAQYAKEIHATTKTILGNINAFALEDNGNRLLKKKYVDYVVDRNGEVAIVSILRGEHDTNTLVDMSYDINKLVEISFDGKEQYLKPYDSNDPAFESNFDKITPFPISTVRGLSFGKNHGVIVTCK